jgi:hypothetical protein
MTERTPEEERRPRLNEDDPEVEGHGIHLGPEEAERRPRLNEDADQGEGSDAEGFYKS